MWCRLDEMKVVDGLGCWVFAGRQNRAWIGVGLLNSGIVVAVNVDVDVGF